MRALGVNVDPRHGYDAAEIRASGAEWVRCVLLPNDELGRGWLAEAHAAGLKVLGVIARESLTDWELTWRTAQYTERAKLFRAEYGGQLDALQVGNEPDLDSPNSWTMRSDFLEQLLFAFRRVFDDQLLIGPGLASGQPYAYSPGLVDVWAVHAYVAPEDLHLSEAPSGLPLWVTEYPATTPGLHDAMVQDGTWAAGFAFCWSESMVPGYGLREDAAALTEFMQAAESVAAANTHTIEREDPMAKVDLASFADLKDNDWGGDWNGIESLPEFAARTRVAQRNDALLLEVTRDDGSVGVYQIADWTDPAKVAGYIEPFLNAPG